MAKKEPDRIAATELVLYADNDAELSRRKEPFEKNLDRKRQRGVYDERASVRLWEYYADEAARRYTREHGSGSGVGVFDKPTRRLVAEEFAQRYAGQNVRSHAESHSDPSHHVGTCDAACRAGRRPHLHREG